MYPTEAAAGPVLRTRCRPPSRFSGCCRCGRPAGLPVPRPNDLNGNIIGAASGPFLEDFDAGLARRVGHDLGTGRLGPKPAGGPPAIS